MSTAQVLSQIADLSAVRGELISRAALGDLCAELSLNHDDQKALEIFVYGVGLGYANAIRDVAAVAEVTLQ